MIKVGNRVQIQGGQKWVLNGKTGIVKNIRLGRTDSIFMLGGMVYEVQLDSDSRTIPFVASELQVIK